ncbi:MAG: GNAT family N-acetyltransferase [Verrucomicrobiaceae bacterium]|nr:MAG: GNAT family N-acetyltransferase [Verrucomicrobiaceae bacterium]
MNPSDVQISEEPCEDRSDARLRTPGAQASLWWKDTPLIDGCHIGTIGAFSAENAETAATLLEAAADHLRDRGRSIAVGPMDGNTWQKHRFVIESNGRGPFLLEPRNAAEYPAMWELAGFSILSRYSSSIMPLDGGEVIPVAVKARLARSGVIVRKLDPSRYDDELRLIHAISLASFSDNFLYTPLPEEGFLQSYRKVRENVDADLVRIAERDGIPCGFVFGIPDLEAAARGEKPALIVKTLAVDPESRCAGLGSLLVDELHRTGREKGYTEAIHALQHESNTSLKITGRHHGEVLRRYALFSLPL